MRGRRLRERQRKGGREREERREERRKERRERDGRGNERRREIPWHLAIHQDLHASNSSIKFY